MTQTQKEFATTLLRTIELAVPDAHEAAKASLVLLKELLVASHGAASHAPKVRRGRRRRVVVAAPLTDADAESS